MMHQGSVSEDCPSQRASWFTAQPLIMAAATPPTLVLEIRKLPVFVRLRAELTFVIPFPFPMNCVKAVMLVAKRFHHAWPEAERPRLTGIPAPAEGESEYVPASFRRPSTSVPLAWSRRVSFSRVGANSC